MRVFLTGGTGFVGSAVVPELLDAGHEVLGLARSQTAAATLHDAGATALGGSLDDPDVLRDGARGCDGVLHLAMARGDVGFTEALELDRRALATLGEALAGSGRPLVFASGTSLVAPGRLVTEHDAGDVATPTSRARAEADVLALAERGVRVAVARLATLVHGDGDRQGFLPMLIEVARRRGVSAHVGDGTNRWPAVHRLDAARLLRLALERAPAGARLHGVAEEGVAFRDLARGVADTLGLPVAGIDAEEAAEHFALLGGPLATLPGADLPASGAITRELLGWRPTGPAVLPDLAAGVYRPVLRGAVAQGWAGITGARPPRRRARRSR